MNDNIKQKYVLGDLLAKKMPKIKWDVSFD